jgi:hypothetical protein
MTLIIEKPTTSKLILAKDYVGIDDPDAAVYIAAVEAADEIESPGIGALETATKVAIHSFVKDCKNDGIWPAIKASCILAGARTYKGALVPLVGTAPTNVSNLFVSGDYDRKTGLVGNGNGSGTGTKYLNSNRNNNADPQNSRHIAAYATTTPNQCLIGSGVSSGSSFAFENGGTISYRLSSGGTVSTGFDGVAAQAPVANSLIATNRSNSAELQFRRVGSTSTVSNTSATPANENITVFARGGADRFSNSRLAFYSIGESLNLALLDTRVSALITAIGAAF